MTLCYFKALWLARSEGISSWVSGVQMRGLNFLERARILHRILIEQAKADSMKSVRVFDAVDVPPPFIVVTSGAKGWEHWLVTKNQVISAAKDGRPGTINDGYFVPAKARRVNKAMRIRSFLR